MPPKFDFGPQRQLYLRKFEWIVFGPNHYPVKPKTHKQLNSSILLQYEVFHLTYYSIPLLQKNISEACPRYIPRMSNAGESSKLGPVLYISRNNNRLREYGILICAYKVYKQYTCFVFYFRKEASLIKLRI